MHAAVVRDIRQLRDEAIALLTENDAGGYTKPSSGQYPHQWNWDSALVAIGIAKQNPMRALEEMASLLAAQWDNGMVPHIVFHHPELTYFPDAGFWQTGAHHQPGCPTSGITQPPVLATALRRIAEVHHVDGFIAKWYPALVAWHRWFHVTRAVDDTALATIVHPWESGTDDSPRWLSVMERFTPTDLPSYRRVDLANVDVSERPSDRDYERYVYLVDLQRKANWDQAVALETSPFCVQDVLTNSILLRADEDLIWLGNKIGADTSEIEGLRAKALASFNDRFWNDERGLYLDYDVRTGTSIDVNTAMTFLPMWAGLCDEDQVDALMEHLLDPEEYWFEPGEGFMVSTAARNEPTWSPNRYWRGPVWVLMNWFLHGGLLRYGRRDTARRVLADTVQLLQSGGFVEYFNVQTGEPCGARAFSWSASLALDLLHE